jgi:cytochrome c-type biogenesis protein CcmH
MAASKISPARLALGGAAAIAVAAIGVAVWRGQEGAAPPPANSQVAAAPVGDVGSMIGQLEAKMRDAPRDPDGWRMLGWAYFETGRYADSANAYGKAAALAPDKAEYWSALGEATVLAEKGGVGPKAQAAFAKALAVDPKDPRARYFMAVRKDMDGDHKGAVDDWIALLKDAPAGAPWAPDVYQLVQKVAKDQKIDVAGRLPAPPAPAAGSPADTATAAIPGPTREQMQAASSLPPSQQDAMVKGMVDGLAAKLAANPSDVDGWIRLIRARKVLNDAAGAQAALAAATKANPAAKAKLTEAAAALGVPTA